MRKILTLLIFFMELTASASLSGNGLFDLQNHPLTTNQTTAIARNPLDTEILVSGSIVDPRARTWSLLNSTDSVNAVQSGAWSTGRTWTLSSGTDSVAATQSGTWTVQQGTPPWSVSQSGSWTSGRTWTLSNATDSVASVQSGSWTTGRTWTLGSGTDSVTSIQGTSPWVSNITQFGSVNLSTGTGASGTGIPRVTVANDSNILATQSGSWTMTANAGTNLNTSALALSATQTNGTQKTQVVDGSGNVQPSGDVLTRKIFVQPTDGTTNQSFVVTTGEVKSITIDKNGTGALTALNQTVTVSTGGMNTAIVQVSGTFSATTVFEGSVDGGATYFTAVGINLGASSVPIAGFTTAGVGALYVGAFTNFRLRVSAFVSGTVNVVINTGIGNLTGIGTQVVRTSDNTGQLITSTADTGSKQRSDVSASSKIALTASAPTSATIAATSTSAIASNATRGGLVFVNNSVNKISCHLNNGSAVLNSGITLYPGGAWTMDEYTYTTAAINCIASAAGSVLGIQELTK